MAASSYLECGVCTNVFSDEHCPRSLPCSHTFCESCISGIITTEKKACPVCREEFSASAAEDLMINRSLLDVAKQFSCLDIGPKTPDGETESQKSCQEFIDNFKEKFTGKIISDCQEAESQLIDAIRICKGVKNIILGSNKDIDELVEKLQRKKRSNEKTLRDSDEDIKVLNAKLHQIQRCEGSILEFDAKLDAAADLNTARPIIDETKTTLEDTQENIKEIPTLVLESEKKAKTTMKNVLKAKVTLMNIATELEKTVDEESPVNITVNDLQSLCGPPGKIVQREVYVDHMWEDEQRVARIVPGSKKEAFQSHFKVGQIPPRSLVIKHEALKEKTSRRAFLDLGYKGTFLGRIIIHVVNESNFGLNFLHMCKGDLGRSYANTNVIEVEKYGDGDESIRFGDYRQGSRKSTQPVISGIDWTKEETRQAPWKEGQVFGNTESVSEFGIVTTNRNPEKKYTCYNFFGCVEEGFDILTEVIRRYPGISDVQVMDCGLIYSF